MQEIDESNSLIKNDNSLMGNQTNRDNTSAMPDYNTAIVDTEPNVRHTFIQNNEQPLDVPVVKKIPKDIIHDFVFNLNLLFTLTTLQLIIPQIVIISSKQKIDYNSFFMNSYWVLLALIIIFLAIILVVFFLKKIFLHKKIGISISLFIIYIMTITLISTFVSFYSVELTLGVSIIQLVSFSSLLLLEFITIMRDKHHIKLSIMYSISIIGFTVYCIVVKKQIVGCFIYIVFLMLFCTYAIFEFKHMLIEFVEIFKVSFEREMSIMVYAIAMMNSNVDILMCCFK